MAGETDWTGRQTRADKLDRRCQSWANAKRPRSHAFAFQLLPLTTQAAPPCHSAPFPPPYSQPDRRRRWLHLDRRPSCDVMVRRLGVGEKGYFCGGVPYREYAAIRGRSMRVEATWPTWLRKGLPSSLRLFTVEPSIRSQVKQAGSSMSDKWGRTNKQKKMLATLRFRQVCSKQKCKK